MTDLQALKHAIDTLQNHTECVSRLCPDHRHERVGLTTCGRCRALWELNKHMRERCSRKKHSAFRKLNTRAHKRTKTNVEEC